jgi:hypothetical protein
LDATRLRFLAIRCDAEGTVREVIRDDFGNAVSACGRPFVRLVHDSSFTKGLGFLTAISATDEPVMTELAFVVDDMPRVLAGESDRAL